ncbi:hypothetical protein EI42_06284 [Thermosporothrix hazakensis]|jgi:hypothetical protein|uniref:Dynein-related subfamily AAA family protein n=2 Tax=Thermosporothrix TaxID=768650 RepID=A0A326TSN9_THEHA|nr:hypothetical protein [Thermosporothrix hazakensis]PZW18224.1 hypothetical protein EI42_06284 [Thermosporothrix hazakensis]BBH91648.1 hypothetical protein KTC_63990 [Thermosporothrix sp. COM3]GCE49792.1 hypothetical protein KTH_46610 [Thermosporothrix hazakensis]
MNYLLPISEEIYQKHIAPLTPRFILTHPAVHLQVNDAIIPFEESGQQHILPLIYRVTAVNRTAKTISLQLIDFCQHTLPLKEAFTRNILISQEKMGDSLRIAPPEFEEVKNAMGGKRRTEQELLTSIRNYITARGYYYDEETLYNYHICLKTRPLVILAGLSGTGKSKLPQLYAEALGHKPRYLRLPVRPNWNDDRYLLGYFNTITGEYIPEPAVEFIHEAETDPYNLYFFCLDEMNLAHVEYYFSQFLSTMEEEQPEDRRIQLYSKYLWERAQKGADPFPYQLVIPENLFFTGTINVDETTKPISDKVIDRANTLEFFSVDLEKMPIPTTVAPPISIAASTWRSYRINTPDLSYRSQIIEINKLLNRADLGLGYRVLHEIELYLANSIELLEPDTAFDLQVKQRILPRIRGAGYKIEQLLNDLRAFLRQQNFPRSIQRLEEMQHRLQHDGYTNFWR